MVGFGEERRRPSVRKELPIDSYSDNELRRLLEWIKSDGKLRTRHELVEAMVSELGYRRRGSRIMSRLEAIAARYG
jgi:hypothetical protein